VTVVRRRSTTPSEPQFTLADVDALSDSNNEPQWLREQRHAAWQVYETTPMPTTKDEEWRRTDIRSIRWDEAAKIVQPNGVTVDVVPQAIRSPLLGEREGGTMVFVDGKLVHLQLSDELKAQDVIFTDLLTACTEHESLVRANLMTKAVLPTDGKFAALHGALWNYGVFVYVPKHKVAELPLHIVMYNTKDGASLGHVLVIVEENAQATVQVEYASAQGQAQSFFCGATELLVGDYANLRYVTLQDWNRQTYDISHHRARIGREANLDWISGNMGSQLTKTFIELYTDGIAANGRISGFFFADKDQHFDLDTQQNHNAPLTTTDLLFKGAAKDTARTVWQGMIKSLPQMQKIDGYQANRNLLLSDDARMDGIPGLEIEADDVKCSHAATFGTLEAEPIHYLMSRGIPRNEAELMVIGGFFDELLQRIPFERVRDRLRDEIEAKILG